MPPKPSRLTPRKRRIICTAAMCIGLFASLGAAHLYTRTQSVELSQDFRVGTFGFKLPDRWAPARRSSATRLSDVQLNFEHPAQTGMTLTVAQVDMAAPTTPVELALGLIELLDAPPPMAQEQFEIIDAGSRAGVRFMWTGGGPDGHGHVITLFTDDAKRYAVIHVEGAGTRTKRTGARIAHAVMRTAVDDGVRPAAAPFVADAGLNPLDAQALARAGFEAAVENDHQAGDPITLRTTARVPHFVRVRVRGTLVLPHDNADSPLHPHEQLLRRVRIVQQREPIVDETSKGELTLADGRAIRWWWALFTHDSDPTHDAYLIRETYYLTDDRTAVLLEAVGDVAGLNVVDTQLAALAEALFTDGGAAEQPDAGLTPSLDATALRGDDLALQARNHFVTHFKDESRFLLSMRQRHRYGFDQSSQFQAPGAQGVYTGVRARIANTRTDSALADLTRPRSATTNVEFRWQTLQSIDHFLWRVTYPDGATGNDTRVTFRSNGTLLTCEESGDRSGHPKWSENVRDGFVPPFADDAWPVATMTEQAAGPALVWLIPSLDHGIAESRPEPCVVLARRQGDRTQVSIRPVMRMDADHLAYDAQGVLVSRTRHDVSANPAGAARADYEAVSRETLYEAYPEIDRTRDDKPDETSDATGAPTGATPNEDVNDEGTTED